MLSLLKKWPELIEAQLLLAQAYESLGRLDDAVAFPRANESFSSKRAAQFLFGLFLLRRTKLKRHARL